jgi:dephospho-CoA kinase
LAAEKNIVRVLLAHNPDSVYLPGTTPEVVLAGHTHGGQFAWVDWLHGRLFPEVYPPSSFITASGKIHAHLTTLIINRGIGGTRVPARFGRRPEAVVVNLIPAKLPPHLIIGISGKPRSGKDTAADLIQQIFPGITRIAFADALKEQFDAARQTNTRNDQGEKAKHRLELHAFSAEKLAKDPRHWIKIVSRTAPPLLITDVRFPLEEEVLRQKGAILIRIEASPKTLRKRLGELYDSQATHPNERWLDQITNWHYVIPNNGSMAELEKRVYAMGKAIKADQSLKVRNN